MTEVRCKNCGRLLGWLEGKGEIKCPRTNCGGKNIFDTESDKVVFIQKTSHVALKDRASSGVTFR